MSRIRSSRIQGSTVTLPTYNDIISETRKIFNKKPCLPQVMACDLQLKCKHVISILPTGSGKTLTFWMYFIWIKTGITLIISPLKSLGDQHSSAQELRALGIQAIHLTKYQVVITSPETVASEPRFEDLWTNPNFCKKVTRIIFDEAHCISEWGDF
ncbi:hypothetical protein BOTBODRAFT_107434 [Botryobasidium botryosum FD-172 SS1]|uniref:DNA 3'-5' helicase n=1 Tax=Botryobasidium botryosum (strain FD-172 SS1) TaxID=930990 RepID=A0A067MKW6_BOTB1|nr:hypothetical protein BOTBODRAFT_107434 [Botryobasidium botryosum FD-172 SS1]